MSQQKSPVLSLRALVIALLLSLVTIICTTLSSRASLITGNAAEPQQLPSPEVSNSLSPSAETSFVRQLSLFTNDVVFDPVTARLYASVSSRGGATGNSIAKINPVTGVIDSSVFIGSEPSKLALSSAAQTLYVSLDGAAAVRRYDLATQTTGIQFALGDSTNGPFLQETSRLHPATQTRLPSREETVPSRRILKAWPFTTTVSEDQ
jgi:hypothetical protein